MCLLFHWSKEVGVGVELKAGIVSTEEELRGQEWKENEERSKILFSFLALILYINAEVSKSLSFWYSFFQGNLSVIILLIYDSKGVSLFSDVPLDKTTLQSMIEKCTIAKRLSTDTYRTIVNTRRTVILEV